MGWQTVTVDGAKGKPKLTLRMSGQIGFNGAFCSLYKIEDYNFAKVLINDEKDKLGIQFFRNKEAETTVIIKKPGNFYITAKQLDNLFGISAQKYELADNVTYETGSNMYLVSIAKKLSTQQNKKKNSV